MSNKNTHLAIFEVVCSHISPEPLELQKNYLYLLASSSEELSNEKNISQNQVIFAKTLFCQKKSKLF